MRYLITGFQAFGGDDLNPTELLLEWILRDPQLSYQFVTQLLPVEFNRAHELILGRDDLDSFDGVISFGLAGGRSKISLERVGLNWVESMQPDNVGVLPNLGLIESTSEKAFMSKINLQKLFKDFEGAGLPVEISLSAGGYVCNYLYFNLLKALPHKKVLFIHVPYLQEQVLNKPANTPFVTQEILKKMLHILMQSLRAD